MINRPKFLEENYRINYDNLVTTLTNIEFQLNSVLDQINSLNLNVTNKKKSFSDYTDDLKNSYFCASPRGNGIDCHRTWESLYYDCIPIVQKHFIYDSFDAPIIQIEKSSDLTHNFLNDIALKYQNKIINFDKNLLTIDYWLNKIKK